MLNKVLVMTIVSSVLAVVRVWVPDLPIPEGFEAAIGVVIVAIAGWFTRETQATVDKLSLK